MNRLDRLLCLWALGAMLAACGGCVGVAAAPVLGASLTAGDRGYAFWQSGTLKYVDEAGFEEMSRAVEATNERLALALINTSETTSRDGDVTLRRWKLRSDRGKAATITIRKITARMVGVSIDVGLFGNRPAARLYADRLRTELESIRDAPKPGDGGG